MLAVTYYLETRLSTGSLFFGVLLPLVDFPASQAAASKFCSGFGAAPELTLDFWRSSNSARTSGSTFESAVSLMSFKLYEALWFGLTVLHQVRHPKDKEHTESRKYDHGVLQNGQR